VIKDRRVKESRRRARYAWAKAQGATPAEATTASQSVDALLAAFPDRDDFPPALVVRLRSQLNVYGPRTLRSLERSERYHELKRLGADHWQASEGSVSVGPFERIKRELAGG
jgi:hypothetical protein